MPYRDEFGLTPRRRAFADLVIKGESQTDAYFAVYSVRSHEAAKTHGARLMRTSEEVRNYIAFAREKAAVSVGVDQEWVRQRLVRIIEYGMQEETTVSYRGRGKNRKAVTQTRMVAPQLARQALEFLGGDVGLGKGADVDLIPQVTPVTSQHLSRC